MNYFMQKVAAGTLVASLTITPFIAATPAHAAVSDWQKGVDLVPTSPTDFGSSNFQQSLQQLKQTGANAVALVIPYYQSNIYSTDVQPGWNTPTDASLAAAIDYAHSLGFTVTLKMHDDPYSGDWRAYIDPSDRAGWFQNYGSYLLHIAAIGQAHHAEMIVIGTELIDMSTYAHNPDNTERWENLIGQVRQVYSGKLTYDANSDNNESGGLYQDEKDYIGFWGSLDYAGISAYYNLNSDNSVSGLEGQWDYWNNNDLRQFAQNVGKPVLFLEVGYRSVDNAHSEPWNWGMSGNANMTEQANDYQALFSYWNNYSYVGGAYLWYWQTDPNAGGTNDTGYTPQNKPAESVMTQWFSSAVAPTPPATSGSYSFTASGNVGGTPAAGSPANLTVSVANMGAALAGGIVDAEVYDQSGNRVFQQFWDNQNIAAGATQTYAASWTPSDPGTYRMTLGVFSDGWATNYYWNSSAAAITVASASSNSGSGSGDTSGGSGDTSTSTNSGGSAASSASAPGPLDVWWPTDGSHVSGVQPIKAMVENIDPSQYRMFWEAGPGQWNEMSDNATDYPHKESSIDFSGWTWNGAGPYPITFIATKTDGSTVLTTKTINIWTE